MGVLRSPWGIVYQDTEYLKLDGVAINAAHALLDAAQEPDDTDDDYQQAVVAAARAFRVALYKRDRRAYDNMADSLQRPKPAWFRAEGIRQSEQRAASTRPD